MNVIGFARGLVLALVLSAPAAASVPPSPFAGVWYTRGQVVGSRLVIHSDGTWETRESRGHWTSSGRRIEMDGNARGWCDGKGEIDDAAKVLTFSCDRSWGRMTTIFEKWEEEPPTEAKDGAKRVREVPLTGSGDIAIDRAEEVTPVQAEPVRPRRAQPVRPTRAQEVKPVRASDIEEFHADEVEPSAPAEEVTLRRPDSGVCTETAPRGARFVGALREGTGDYRYVIEFAELPSSGRVTAHVTINAAEGRVMDGDVAGTVRGGAFTLAGVVQAWPYRWEHRLQGTVSADALRARAATRGVGNAEWTTGELALPAVRGVDPATVGTWAMVVPGAAYTQELDRGSWTERVNRASAGAAAGVLQVTADGAYTWKKRGGTQRGRVTYCETPGGKRGWSVAYDGERFFLGYLEGQNGGFYLFSTRTGDYVYRGQMLK